MEKIRKVGEEEVREFPKWKEGKSTYGLGKSESSLPR